MVTLRLALAQRLALNIFLLIVASVGMSVSAARVDRFPGDLPVADWVQSISIPIFDELMKGVSAAGWWVPGSIITVCLGMALFALGRRSDAAIFIAIVAMSAAANWVIKRIVASPRPDPALVNVHEELTTYGFPSGHVMFAVVCFGGLAIVLSSLQGRNVIATRVAQVILVLLIVAMAMSRVYLGAHWPSDAVGALLIGGLWLVVMVGVREWLQRKQRHVIESSRLP